MLAHVRLKLVACPLSWEATDVDVGVVALLLPLLAGHKVLCFKVRAVEHFASLSSDSVYCLLGLFSIAELDKAVSFALFVAFFGLIADFYALDCAELGEVLLKL